VKLRPNRKMDERFGRAFDKAADSGVEMRAAKFRLRYTAGKLDIELMDFIPVER
jgi:DNA-binding sugar fermentation-stimulating protein